MYRLPSVRFSAFLSCAVVASVLLVLARPVCAQSDPVIYNDAAFVSQSVPTTMEAGRPYLVSLTLQNTGTTTWSLEDMYCLGAESPLNNMLWGGRAWLWTPVAPGETGTFTFLIFTPASAGTYPFQWRMVQETIEWFGEFTPAVNVTVVPPGNQAGP